MGGRGAVDGGPSIVSEANLPLAAKQSLSHGRATLSLMPKHSASPPDSKRDFTSTAELMCRAFANPDGGDSNSPTTENYAALVTSRIRAAAAQLGFAAGLRGVSATKEQIEAFLIGVAAGMPIAQAAAMANVDARSMYRRRRNDADFRHDWDAALEISLGAIDDRLEAIALYGKADSMATVRAAEVLHGARSMAKRKDYVNAGSSVTLKNEDPETGRVTSIVVKSNVPAVD